MATEMDDPARQAAPPDVDEIARNNQLNSPLLRLPGELRNRIYEYIFSDLEIAVVRPAARGIPLDLGTSKPVHVLETCRQIHHEASSIFWDLCIVNAEACHSMFQLETSMAPSDLTRITSFVPGKFIAWDLSRPETLEKFPSLRKLYLEEYYMNDIVEAEAEMLRNVSAKGIEVEYRESEDYDWEEYITTWITTGSQTTASTFFEACLARQIP